MGVLGGDATDEVSARDEPSVASMSSAIAEARSVPAMFHERPCGSTREAALVRGRRKRGGAESSERGEESARERGEERVREKGAEKFWTREGKMHET
jgi:hypothetical protein